MKLKQNKNSYKVGKQNLLMPLYSFLQSIEIYFITWRGLKVWNVFKPLPKAVWFCSGMKHNDT
jgi:hypothetical protein